LETTMRTNEDLDAMFADAPPVNSHRLPKQRRRSKTPGKRDQLRRRAFRVLALLADLGAADRLLVLRAAERLNRA
jgi:hypothetical protein